VKKPIVGVKAMDAEEGFCEADEALTEDTAVFMVTVRPFDPRDEEAVMALGTAIGKAVTEHRKEER
jgi:hypothetical protein